MLSTHSSKHYPYAKSKKNNRILTNKIILGLGSNVGNCIFVLEKVFCYIDSHRKIDILQTSPIYKNPPFGYVEQNDFYNAIIFCQSSLNLIELFRFIFYVERRFGRGRKRKFKNAPRNIDIDIIFFNDLNLRLPHLQIPHIHYKQRISVMLPLSTIE